MTTFLFSLGPDVLSRFSNSAGAVVPTLVTSMYQNRVIRENMFSIYFRPYSDAFADNINGDIVFGGGNTISHTHRHKRAESHWVRTKWTCPKYKAERFNMYLLHPTKSLRFVHLSTPGRATVYLVDILDRITGPLTWKQLLLVKRL